MGQNILNMITKVREAANILGSAYLAEIANIAEVGCSTEKLSITIVGKAKVVIPILESLFDNTKILPSKITSRCAKLHMSIDYSDSPFYKISKNSQPPLIVSKDLFFQHLSDNEDIHQDLKGDIRFNDELLKLLNLSVIFIDNGYDGFEWQSVLLKSDYTFFAMDATQLLSMTEQNFIAKVLSEVCNPERYAIVVASMDCVAEEERADVLGCIDSYTLQLNSVIPQVFPFGKEEITPLSDFIRRFIPANTLHIRQKSQIQHCEFLERELFKYCRQTKESLLSDNGHSQLAIREIGVNCEKVQSKIKSTERNIELFINSNVKSKFIRKIDLFAEALNVDIKSEIIACDDMDEASRQIPIYLKETWAKFIEQQNQWLKNAIFAEIIEISKVVENDIKEIVNSIDPHTFEAIKHYLPSKFRYNAFLFPKRDKGDSLKYIDLGALAMMLFSIPWAIVTFGTSQLIRYLFKEERLKAKKESLAQATIESSNKMKSQIINQSDIEVEKISNSLKDQTRGVYQSILHDFIVALETYQSNIENSEAIITYIDSIVVTKCNTNQ